MENVNFVGIQSVVGRASTIAIGRPTIYGYNCSFKYNATAGGSGGGGFRTEGADSYLVNCVASFNRFDGFNYHTYFIGGGGGQTYTPNAFELNCTSNKNGWYNAGETPDYNDNGSTMHDGGSVLRLNCSASQSQGPNFVDVGNDTSSYNVNCNASTSLAASNSRNYEVQGVGAKMYLIKCKSDGLRTFDLLTDSQGTFYIYKSNAELTSGTLSFIQQYQL